MRRTIPNNASLNKYFPLVIVCCLLIFYTFDSYSQATTTISWKVNNPVFTASTSDGFDNASVKDPSIVFYNNKWHLFYTAFSAENHLQIGYVNAKELDLLNEAERTVLNFHNDENLAGKYAAPQVFYFEPLRIHVLDFLHLSLTYYMFLYLFQVSLSLMDECYRPQAPANNNQQVQLSLNPNNNVFVGLAFSSQNEILF
jgi:hypothetical protein